jgi:MATE family multidrug resistance protein
MQAVGAGKLSRLPTLYQRTVLFLLAHCIPITGIMLGMPRLINLTCHDPELSIMVKKFMVFIIPGVFIEALSRPLSRILVATRIAAPLMV